MAKEAIILAGGIGSRLHSVVSDVPKPLAVIKDKPFLSYLLEQCFSNGYKRIILSVGYMHEKIIETYGTQYKDCELVYAVEKQRLGTGGAINFALAYCKTDDILILNGDSIFNVDLISFNDFYASHNANFCMALTPMSNFDRYGVVEVSKHKISKFIEKGFTASGLINTGIYLLNKIAFQQINFDAIFSFEEQFLQKYVSEWNFYGFVSNGLFIDIGIPEDYKKAQSLLPLEFNFS